MTTVKALIVTSFVALITLVAAFVGSLAVTESIPIVVGSLGSLLGSPLSLLVVGMAYSTFRHPTDPSRQLEVHDWSIKTYRRVGATERRIDPKNGRKVGSSKTYDQKRFAMTDEGVAAATVEYDKQCADAVAKGWVAETATSGASGSGRSGKGEIPSVIPVAVPPSANLVAASVGSAPVEKPKSK